MGGWQVLAAAAVLVALVACGGSRPAAPTAASHPPSSHAARVPSADAAAVVAALRQGGYVLYFRHAAADSATVQPAHLVLEDCRTQPGLSVGGRAQAESIGRAFERLRVPVGAVRSSPYCRCADTARLAFGYLLLDDDLRPLSDGAGEGRGAALGRLLATPPLPGRNSVLVGHAENLQQVAGIALEEGEAAIIRPAPAGGSYSIIGRVRATQWQAVAVVGGSAT